MFVTDDGRNVLFTFVLLVLLFALWGFCNGMIDVMDKHFQEELHLTLAQSAWVQFAHYLGYFLMALPAGWLATKLGYKGGIITGLLIVAVGRVLVHPGDAHRLVLGVPARGLHHRRRPHLPRDHRQSLHHRAGATRIRRDPDQSRPILQRHRPASRDRSPAASSSIPRTPRDESTGAEQLWIPYAAIGVVVLILAVVFYFAEVPDIKMEDDYHLDDSTPKVSHSIWSHPHFVMAVVAQFLYVAAQAGIFSFFLNYMTSQMPPIPASWQADSGFFAGWFEAHKNGALGFSNKGAANLASLGFLCFLIGRFTGTAILKKVAAHTLLGLYGAINVALCLVVFLRLGWVSVVSVFLSYFFMSIMFPTIFASGDFRPWRRGEEGVLLHRHGDHGRRHPAEADGRGCRQIRSLPRFHRAVALLRRRRGLWVLVAETQRSRGYARCVGYRRALGYDRCI